MMRLISKQHKRCHSTTRHLQVSSASASVSVPSAPSQALSLNKIPSCSGHSNALAMVASGRGWLGVKQSKARRQLALALALNVRAAGPGGGVADKPATAFPKFDLDKDVRTRKKKPPRYQVLLHNDDVNRRDYVVKVLLKIVPTLTMDDAVNIMNEAHINGMAAVIICGQEEAEEYCEGLRKNGLISTIEPVGPSD